MAIKKTPESIDEYIATFPKDVQRRLMQMRFMIQRGAPQAKEEISYGMPSFTQDGNLVYFGAFKKHIGFFPTAAVIVAFKKELAPYKCSKGTVQFPFDKPMPLALIARMVKFRVKEKLRQKK